MALVTNARGAGTPRLRRMRRNLGKFGFLTPAVVTLLGVNIAAALYGIAMSFMAWNNYQPADRYHFVGLHNYQAVFADPTFLLAIKNTVIWTGIGVPCAFVVGLYFALLLNQPIKLKWLFRSIILLPWVTPLVVTAVAWQFALSPGQGLLDTTLAHAGFSGFLETNWLGDPSYALPILIGIQVWTTAPFFTVVLLAALQGIPKDVYQAAAIDGAGHLRSFRYVTLPLLRPVAAVSLVQGAIWSLQSFTLVYILTQGGPAYSTEIITVYLWQQAFGNGQVGIGAAAGGVLIAALLVAGTVWVAATLRRKEAV
jgi:multiple sugar transport system permease protein